MLKCWNIVCWSFDNIRWCIVFLHFCSLQNQCSVAVSGSSTRRYISYETGIPVGSTNEPERIGSIEPHVDNQFAISITTDTKLLDLNSFFTNLDEMSFKNYLYLSWSTQIAAGPVQVQSASLQRSSRFWKLAVLRVVGRAKRHEFRRCPFSGSWISSSRMSIWHTRTWFRGFIFDFDQIKRMAWNRHVERA